jgi:hypothetical protein
MGYILVGCVYSKGKEMQMYLYMMMEGKINVGGVRYVACLSLPSFGADVGLASLTRLRWLAVR